MKILKITSVLVVVCFLVLVYENIMAFRTGIVGLTKKRGEAIGCVCHEFKPNDSTTAIISGPSNVHVNDTVIYQLTISGGPAIAGGCDIAVSLGNIYPSVLDTGLRRAEPNVGAGFELTHKEPKLFTSGTCVFTFMYVAPSTQGVDTLFANGNSTDNNGQPKPGDIWNFSPNKIIQVGPSAVQNQNEIVNSFELKQNYPNPFNPDTKIEFTLRSSSVISLNIYDINGKEVAKMLSNKFFNSGNYSVTLNAEQYGLTSGVYFYKLMSDNNSEMKKMILVK